MLGRGEDILLCFNKNLFCRKANVRQETYSGKSFFQTETFWVLCWVLNTRIPWRPTEAAAFATAYELHFEPSGKRPNPLRSGAEMPMKPGPGPSLFFWYERDERGAGFLLYQECWFIPETHNCWVVWHSTEASSSQRA